MTLNPSRTYPGSRQASSLRQNTFVVVMFFAAGIVFLDRAGITYLFPDISRDLGLNDSQLGSLASVTAVGWAISSVVFSVLSDRFGTRTKPIIVTCLVLFSLASGFVGLAPNYRTILLLRALLGICEGPVLPLVQAAVARASSPERRGRNLGTVFAGSMVIGGAAAPSIMFGLAGSLGWRLSFPVTAGAGIVVAILVSVFMHEDRANAGVADQVRLRDFRLVVANRNVLLTLIGSVVCIGWTIGFGAFAPQFLATEGLSSGMSTLVLTVSGVLMAVGAVVASTVSDRVGRKLALFVAAVCLGLIPLFFILFAHSVSVLLVSLIVSLMAGGALNLVTFVVPGESVPANLAATAFAVEICAGELIGGALGPQAGGVIADTTHNLANGLLLYALAPILVVIVSLLIRETAPRKRRGAAVPDAMASSDAPRQARESATPPLSDTEGTVAS